MAGGIGPNDNKMSAASEDAHGDGLTGWVHVKLDSTAARGRFHNEKEILIHHRTKSDTMKAEIKAAAEVTMPN